MRHHKDLIEIAKFLDHVNKSFSNLCDHQGSIVSAYNSLAEIWSDKVYSITGEALCETAGTTEQAYNAFYDVCAQEYENVGDSWADNQYVQLGEELEEFCRNTARQIESLEQLGNLLERKRIKILESEDLA